MPFWTHPHHKVTHLRGHKSLDDARRDYQVTVAGFSSGAELTTWKRVFNQEEQDTCRCSRCQEEQKRRRQVGTFQANPSTWYDTVAEAQAAGEEWFAAQQASPKR